MRRHRGDTKTGVLIGLVVAAAVLGAGLVIWKADVFGERGPGYGRRWEQTVAEVGKVDANLLTWEEVLEFETGFRQPRAICHAVARIYVAGDEAVRVFDLDGRQVSEHPLSYAPVCIAADGDYIFAAEAGALHRFETPSEYSAAASPAGGSGGGMLYRGNIHIADIALTGESILLTDLAGKRLLVLNRSGHVVKEIDGATPRDDLKFNVPGECFAVAVGIDGLARVVNPGRLRVEAWTLEGDREFVWGKGSNHTDGFAGCCNPMHIAVLPDGRIVTSEKGIARVKVYKPDGPNAQPGVLDSVVAGPDELAGLDGYDVAVDSRGRVVLLDVQARTVRVFAERPKETSND